jgi:hypothetical protein
MSGQVGENGRTSRYYEEGDKGKTYPSCGNIMVWIKTVFSPEQQCMQEGHWRRKREVTEASRGGMISDVYKAWQAGGKWKLTGEVSSTACRNRRLRFS